MSQVDLFDASKLYPLVDHEDFSNGSKKSEGTRIKKSSIQNPTGQSRHQALMRAVQLCSQGDFQRAEEVCTRLLGSNSADPDAQHLLGQIMYQQGKLESAINHFQKAAKTKPDDAQIFYNLGVALQDIGDFSKAEANYQRAVSLQPSDAEFLNSLGAVLYQQDRLEDATAKFRQALHLQPDNVEALSNLGSSLCGNGQFDEAASVLRKAITIQPDYGDALYNLGVARRALGELGEAEQCFKNAISLQPTDTNIIVTLGNLLRDLGRYQEALLAYDKALAIDPHSFEVSYNQGLALWDLYLYEQARSSFDRAREINPDFCETYFHLAQISTALGSFEQGEVLMLRATSTCSNKQLIWECIGNFYFYWDRHEKALEAYSKSIKFDQPSAGSLQALSFFAPNELGFDLCSLIDQARREVHVTDIESLSRLDFAYARARDKQNDHAKAWSSAVLANSNYIVNYRIKDQNVTDFVPKVLPNAWCNSAVNLPASAEASERPLTIFIAGMPRSGKTTLEKLITTYNLTQRGYENNLINQILPEFKCSNLSELRESDIPLFQKTYHQKIRERMSGQLIYCVTISSTYFLENCNDIVNVLPNSIFLLMDRNILDNALRIFLFRYPKRFNNYSYRLSSIMNQIEVWRDAIDWWCKAAPNKCQRLSYEDLINDPNHTLSKVFALCQISSPVSHNGSLPDDRDCAKPYEKFLKEHLESEGYLINRSE